MKKSLPQFFFLLIVLLITVAFFGLIGGFLFAVFWAVIFAILFYNRFEIFNRYFNGRKNLAAALTLLYIFLLVMVPLAVVTIVVINEAQDVAERINSSDVSLRERVAELQNSIPIDDTFLSRYGLNTIEVRNRITEFLTTGSQKIAGQAVTITQNFFGFIISFSLMLYVLFFFLRDGKELVRGLIWVLPIGDRQEWTLLRRFESVARATVKGSLLVALSQGVMGGLLFAAVGIDAAFLWGVLMVLAALLPVGSVLVWGPWAAVMFFQGEYGRGIALVIVGACFIGLIDNILRPRLVGQDTKMPDYLVLLSTLGGLTWFGLSGFVIGPIIAALFVTCWQMLGREYGEPYRRVKVEEVITQIQEEERERKIAEEE